MCVYSWINNLSILYYHILSFHSCVCVCVDFLLQVSEVKRVHQTRKVQDNVRSLAFLEQTCSKRWLNRQVLIVISNAIAVRQNILLSKSIKNRQLAFCSVKGMTIFQTSTSGCLGSNSSQAYAKNSVKFGVVFFKGCFNTPLEHTPKPLPKGWRGIPFIIGLRDCLGCALGVCWNNLAKGGYYIGRFGSRLPSVLQNSRILRNPR